MIRVYFDWNVFSNLKGEEFRVFKEKLLKNLYAELKKGSIVLVVLAKLHNQHYGYSLVQTLSDDHFAIDQNTLYPLLRRLEEQGLLNSSWEVVDPRPRKYYEISPLGKEVYLALKETYLKNTNIINNLIKEH